MSREIKIRIHDQTAMEARLKSIGARFDREVRVKDTYFRAPHGEVVKISETSEGDFLVRLKPSSGGFDYTENRKIDDAFDLRRQLSAMYGIKSVLEKRRRLYKLKETVFDINIIDGVGTFLVVIGPKVSNSTITKELGVKNPEYITVPFDELPRTA